MKRINGISAAVAGSVAEAGKQAAINWSQTIGDAVGMASDFLRSCEGNCWAVYPPFSGKGQQRGECLKQCKQLATTVQPANNQAGIGELLKIGIPVAMLAYVATRPKTKKRGRK